jgi:hypothetical protein
MAIVESNAAPSQGHVSPSANPPLHSKGKGCEKTLYDHYDANNDANSHNDTNGHNNATMLTTTDAFAVLLCQFSVTLCSAAGGAGIGSLGVQGRCSK